MKRQQQLNKLIKSFSILAYEVSLANNLNLQDINIHMEDLFVTILNSLYKNKTFRNINNNENNASAIDLGDSDYELAYQVT